MNSERSKGRQVIKWVIIKILELICNLGKDIVCCAILPAVVIFRLILYIPKGASTPSNIASNIAGNSFHLNSGVQGGDIAGN